MARALATRHREASTSESRASIEAFLRRVRNEWPELYRIHLKLRRSERLGGTDAKWLVEAAKAAG